MSVKNVDLKTANNLIWKEIQQKLKQTIENSHFVAGNPVDSFEEQFAKYIGTNHCITTNTGTSALHLALLACNIGTGDEIITTPHSWIATSLTINYTGAVPIFIDIKDFNINPNLIEKAITSRTKAILPVHLYGQPANLDKIKTICKKHNLFLIEDACQAHGAKYKGVPVGSIGDIGCFSFYPTKNLGSWGNGGCLTTNNTTLASKIKILKNNGQLSRHHHTEIGYNYKMDGIQATVLSAKLKYLDKWNENRKIAAQKYKNQLKDVEEIILPKYKEEHIWHLYVIRAKQRNKLQKYLKEKEIETAIHYPTLIPYQPIYKKLNYIKHEIPVAEKIVKEILTLPMHPFITTEEIKEVSNNIKEFYSISKK